MGPGAAQDESEDVLAFIAARRVPVLNSAVVDIAEAAPDDLPAVVHRVRGILGSYGLFAAQEHVDRLSDALNDDDADAEARVRARRTTVDALRALADGEVDQ